ncbi:hypothetical protein L1887_44430 [Cichorium endivia]|nr:hypothetical protein L1887_44430 [Cichorium endivia]
MPTWYTSAKAVPKFSLHLLIHHYIASIMETVRRRLTPAPLPHHNPPKIPKIIKFTTELRRSQYGNLFNFDLFTSYEQQHHQLY